MKLVDLLFKKKEMEKDSKQVSNNERLTYSDSNLEYYEEFETLWNKRDQKRSKELFCKLAKSTEKSRLYWKYTMSFAFYCYNQKGYEGGELVITKSVLHNSVITFHQFLVRSNWRNHYNYYCLFYLVCLFNSLQVARGSNSNDLLRELLSSYMYDVTANADLSEIDFISFTHSMFRSIIKRRTSNTDKEPKESINSYDYYFKIYIQEMSWRKLQMIITLALDYDLNYQSPLEWYEYYEYVNQKKYLPSENKCLSWICNSKEEDYPDEFNLIRLFIDCSVLSAGILSTQTLTQIVIGSIALAKCFLSKPKEQVKSLLEFSKLSFEQLVSFLVLFAKSFRKWNSTKPPFIELHENYSTKLSDLFEKQDSKHVLHAHVNWILLEKAFLQYFEPTKLSTTKTIIPSPSNYFLWHQDLIKLQNSKVSVISTKFIPKPAEQFIIADDIQ